MSTTRLQSAHHPVLLTLAIGVAALAVGCGVGDEAEGRGPQGSEADAQSVTLADCDGQSIKVAEAEIEEAGGIPLYVAEGDGVLERMGMQVERTPTGSVSGSIAAALSGSVDVARTTVFGPIAARADGAPVKVVAGMVSRLPLQMVVQKEVLEKAGVTQSSPLEEKLELVKELNFGAGSPGGGSDTVPRLLAAQAGGEDDIKINYLGSGANLVAAFIRGNIDAFAAQVQNTLPAVEQADGVLLFDFAAGKENVPGLSDLLYGGLAVSDSVMQERPEMLTCLNAAIMAGMELLQTDVERAKESARNVMTELDDAMFEKVFTANVPSFSETPVIEQSTFEKSVAFQEKGQGEELDVTFDDLAVNRFAEEGVKLFTENRSALLGE